jgi:hypothetical protein
MDDAAQDYLHSCGGAGTELVYTYLDRDVCKWLKDNKPQPQKGKN